MLEGLVAWVLNNYLGKYVENLNTDQLSIALLSGQVELENLPLKKDASRHLGLPIEIETGFIGKIILQIPVRQIRSAPWVIIIEQLYVVGSPLSVQDWDSRLEQLTNYELKLSALDALEAQWRLETESKDSSNYYASTYSSWLHYGTGFITDIIENLQLKIHDVHIRYEDSLSVPNKTVAFGVTMESLAVQSCDSNWIPEFTHWDSSAASFKLVDMQKLAVYWKTVEKIQKYSHFNIQELKTIFSQLKGHSQNQNCILAPVSAQAHIRHNRSEKPLRSAQTPRIVCDLNLEEVPLTLVDWQYEQIVKCMNYLDNIGRLRKFWLYRPNCTVKDNPRLWWIYAVSCHFIDTIPLFCKAKPSWDHCLQRARENVAYVKLYTDILTTPTMALTPEDKKLKDDVEWDRNYEELRVLREISMKRVPVESFGVNRKNSAGRGVLLRWFPNWMGWYSSNHVNESSSFNNPSSQLEGEILEALSDSSSNNTLLKRDVVFGQFNFSLDSGVLNLCTTNDSNTSVPMIEFQFKKLNLKITSCPRISSHSFELSLGAIYLRDKLTVNSLFPVLMGPPEQERVMQLNRSRGTNPKTSTRAVEENSEPLFSLLYEKRAENSNCDYRLSVKSKSLDVVYQPFAIKWLIEFLCQPHRTVITHSKIEAMKLRTKKELFKNWEQMLDGRLSSRKSWQLNLDISTPQIIFVENFTEPNSNVAIIDFGRLHLKNIDGGEVNGENHSSKMDNEEEEMFMTPCSTPPGSEENNSETFSPSFTPQNQTVDVNVINEQSLHQKLYESYSVELTDLQILISKAKDNWRYAHNKGTSPLHILDRFNISLQIERCIVHTCDPLYPSLTMNANLPKLVAHINEQKVASAKSLFGSISVVGFPSPFNTPETDDVDNTVFQEDDESSSVDMSLEMSRLLIFQFSIDQLALEVQSRGRSIAELQVSGVRASFSKRPIDVSITLSVHSLLLVDALQTFGPDFELLIASHKHVGMDSMSGSLRDSEPTSPTSPASPDPCNVPPSALTTPLAITQALSKIPASPPNPLGYSHQSYRPITVMDSEALITIEIVLITGLEPMHIANIQFNNLDIIANQETIVELMGFVHRAFPDARIKRRAGLKVKQPEVKASVDTIDSLDDGVSVPNICKTEITFDFHRLNVLILRGVFKDGSLLGKKIATATMSDAKIQATVDNGVLVEGSLGGLQVVDLTTEGQTHQRLISVGHDPLSETMHPMYLMSQSTQEKERKAFSFKIKRNVNSSDNDIADVSIRMASVWYTHSPLFIDELQSCATEFKQYLANLARSIRTAATDMALGLVQSKTEALAQSLYLNSKLSSSLYGSALSFSDIVTSRKRYRRTSSMDQSDGFSGYSTARDTVIQTPYTPEESLESVINIKLDVVLDSPVVILPRSSSSPEVFVAHLGKISVTNQNSNQNWRIRSESYIVEVKDMNLFSLDTSSRRTHNPAMMKVDVLYACDSLAKPILYDTVLQLNIEREFNANPESRQRSLSDLLDEDFISDTQSYDGIASDGNNIHESIQISGTFVTSLKLSLTRAQYEQLLATLQFLTTSFSSLKTEETPRASTRILSSLTDICEEDSTGVTTLKMDPHVRAKMFNAVPGPNKNRQTKNQNISVKVLFELPLFTIELRGNSHGGEQGLVDLSFRDFIFNYEKCHRYETNVQVSLRSVIMEDLLQAEDSKQRIMVISSDGNIPNPSCISRSCPDAFDYYPPQSTSHGSLPDHLEPAKILGANFPSAIFRHVDKRANGCPETPPPSPSVKERPQKNLVLISSLLVDPDAPNFKTFYNSVERSTSVDFNCLDLVVNVESWVIVIDFFSVTPSDYNLPSENSTELHPTKNNDNKKQNIENNISIRSLNIVLVKPKSDLAKINISQVEVSVKTDGIEKEVEGHLGSMSLLDLTLHGQIYKERFLTSGKQALHFNYTRFSPDKILNFDSQLKLEMSAVLYVHTKRFSAEIQAFFNRFTHLQAVMSGIRAATSRQQSTNEVKRLSIILKAGAPVIFLPVSSRSSDLLIADLGQLNVSNTFKFSGDGGTISVVKNLDKAKKCLLDVMSIELQNVDLYAGVKENVSSKKHLPSDSHLLGNVLIKRKGASFLKNKCFLKIQVERNLHSDSYHNVPNMSIQGELSTLDVALDVEQYKIIRGLLNYNLGEYTEHILPSVSKSSTEFVEPSGNIWTLLSIKFNLSNVILNLYINPMEPIARINFIRSQLTVESFSNFSQDVDLVSQEIVVMDTRHQNKNCNKNVFTNILQPIVLSQQDGLVQLEVHSRKRKGKTKFTILLNNMRLMTIFDWWEFARIFIFQDYEVLSVTSPTHEPKSENKKKTNEDELFELKLNITDSEIVVVQDTSQWDTNAVILKSTTVITYKSYNTEKPLSMNLNNCEAYSCVLGMEEETALSIIDPVTLNMEIVNKTLEVQLNQMKIHLSYRDMRMFLKILNSLPQQIIISKTSNENYELDTKNEISKLTALGFSLDDCKKAYDICGHKLDDAALWLTQNATLVRHVEKQDVSAASVIALEVKASCILLTIIDDCGDSDVPLIEISFGKLFLKQSLINIEKLDQEQANKGGTLECILAGDYYNRVLSGWEPILEPWKCTLKWDNVISSNLDQNRLQISVESKDVLNLNVTSTFTELYQQVKNNWMQDIYLPDNSQDYKSPHNHKIRSPFVPFALKNDTGSILRFTTLINEMDSYYDSNDIVDVTERWVLVAPGDVVPFSFKSREKMRHKDSHKLKMHQLCVKVDGWKPIRPVTVDKAGVYFRHAAAEIHSRTLTEPPNARIVFDVALKGSAQKLVTVRSSLIFVNKLKKTLEIKLENALYNPTDEFWVPEKIINFNTNQTIAIPLTHAHSQISVRPINERTMYSYCNNYISWKNVTTPGESSFELRSSSTYKDHLFRFCVEIKRENYPPDKTTALMGINGHYLQPGHTITLLPILLLCNLLPVEISYGVSKENGRISPGNEASLTTVDPDNTVEISIQVENFPNSSKLLIPSNCLAPFYCRMKLEDHTGRRLFLQANIIPNFDARIKVSFSAPYWIINKTGLPLIFKQGGVTSESAGQFEEHEVARMVTHFLFSFADSDGSPTVTARVGSAVIPHGHPVWCQNFHLRKGIQVRRLHVTLKNGHPDVVYIIGIQVRAGKGKYRSTTIVTLSPRFQLHNKSSYQLTFTQKYFAHSSDQKSVDNHVKTVSGCHIAYHWPRLDKEQLLCVKIEDVQNCCFSGGLKIDANDSMHVNVRDVLGRIYFLRMEVVLEGATFFVLFTDADTMPPPIRVDNFSEVAMTFWQTCCKDTLRCTVRSHTSIPYAWDEPTGPSFLTVSAPGGVSNNYDMNKIGNVPQLTYENFIYIAFTGTFKDGEDVLSDPMDVENQQLVLDVINEKDVILNRKIPAQRSQLWRMTASGELQHEGSCPPSHPGQQPKPENVLVLDIDGAAPQPNTYSRLIIRKPEQRRKSTQTWRFTEDGRLSSVHYNMCVQAQDGFFGLRPGNSAVLGLPQSVCHRTTPNGIPLEQAISRQRLRPGSGVLSLEITTDGPTRVLNIRDMNEKSLYAVLDEREWNKIVKKQRPHLKHGNEEEDSKKAREYQFTLKLAGLGVSVVTRKPFEELLYGKFETIVGETVITRTARTFCISVKNIQVDNQLLDTSVPVILYVTPPKSHKTDDEYYRLPALEISTEVQSTPNENAVIFKHLIVNLKKLTINLEEKFTLKLLCFIELGSKEDETLPSSANYENDYEMQRMLTEVSASYAKRYYFGVIQLVPNQIRLSMKTASKLPPELKAAKRKFDIPFIKFEDALVDLEPFIRRHPFETSQFLISSIKKHFKDELIWQAGIILGSVDVLGNPVGFMNDVSEGVSGFIWEGSLGSLVKNVTHGLSNSAAKVTESISDGLGRVTMDDEHEEMRQRIRQVEPGRTGDHLVAGIKGLSFGILGGATSIFKHVYEGAANEGIQGVFSGLGKGLVGTVTKPVVGVLDLASETARAVRETSRSRVSPERSRLPRCVWGTGGLLPPYSRKQSKAQQLLYIVNDRNYSEHLVAFERLRGNSEDLKIIVSNHKVWIVASATGPTTVLEVHLSDLQQCQSVTVSEGSDKRYYIEITMKISTSNTTAFYQEAVKRPRIRCDSYDLACWVSQQVNYAKRLYDERLLTLTSDVLEKED